MNSYDEYGHLRRPTTIRLEDGLKERLKEQAATNKQTMNREIEYRLEDSFRERAPITTEHFRLLIERLDEMSNHIQKLSEQLDALASQNSKPD